MSKLTRAKNRGGGRSKIKEMKDPEVELAIALSKSLQAQIDEETLKENAYLVEIGLEHEVVIINNNENKVDFEELEEPKQGGRKKRKKVEPKLKIISKLMTISVEDRTLCLNNRVAQILEQSSIECENIENDVNLKVAIPYGVSSSRLKSSINYENRLWNFAHSELEEEEEDKKGSISSSISTIPALKECKIRNNKSTPTADKIESISSSKIKIPVAATKTFVNSDDDLIKNNKKKKMIEFEEKEIQKVVKKVKLSIETETQTEMVEKKSIQVQTMVKKFVDQSCQTDDVIIIDKKALQETKNDESMLFNKTLEEEKNHFERNRSNGRIEQDQDYLFNDDDEDRSLPDENKIINISSDLSFDFGTQPPVYTSSPLVPTVQNHQQFPSQNHQQFLATTNNDDNNYDWESMDENDLLQVEALEKESQNLQDGKNVKNKIVPTKNLHLHNLIIREEPKTPPSSSQNYSNHRFSSQGHHPTTTTTPETPATPMLEYSTIDTPILKQEMKRFGLKPLPRSKAKVLLRHIYKETHKK